VQSSGERSRVCAVAGGVEREAVLLLEWDAVKHACETFRVELRANESDWTALSARVALPQREIKTAGERMRAKGRRDTRPEAAEMHELVRGEEGPARESQSVERGGAAHAGA
jgi:hypothetical protein